MAMAAVGGEGKEEVAACGGRRAATTRQVSWKDKVRFW